MALPFYMTGKSTVVIPRTAISERETAVPIILKLTCYTKEHGTIIREWEGTQLPDMLVVPVGTDLQKEIQDRKFDPRVEWATWMHTDGPTFTEVYCQHFAGTVYIEQSLRFMKKQNQFDPRIIVKPSDSAFGKVMAKFDMNSITKIPMAP